MKVAYRKEYCLPLPEGHRFPMEKYDLFYRQLLHHGYIDNDDVIIPGMESQMYVANVHDKEYLNKLAGLALSRQEERRTGFPLTQELVNREYYICSGAIRLTEESLKDGVSFNLAGGTHHAFSGHGEGFCIFNDHVVASDYLMREKGLSNILILDLDVHQGNGSASMCMDIPEITTISVHGKNNYPMHKPGSSIDVPLEDGVSDNQYLDVLHNLLEKNCSEIAPEFLFYQSGVDVLQTDKLGRMALSMEACKRRDEMVFQWASDHEVPVLISMGGGYSPDIRVIVNAHMNTFVSAEHILGV